MKHGIAGWAVALLFLAGAVHPAAAAAIRIDKAYEQEARSIIADLDFFIGRYASFAQGATEPLLYGRSLPVPPESCEGNGEPRRFALLLGPSDAGPPNLAVPAVLNDVTLLSSVLSSVGASEDDIHVLTGDGATRHGVIEATWEILSQLRCGDKVLVYFGGYAIMQDEIASVVSGEIAAPSGRWLDVLVEKARNFLGKKVERADVIDIVLAIRRSLDMLEWYRSSGLTLLLNGEGRIDTDPTALSGFEIMTSADLSELVTLLRNHRADVTVVLDTNHASEADLFRRQQAATPDFWSADVVDGSQEATQGVDSRLHPTRLSTNPGDLAVFYSSIDKGLSVSTGFGSGGDKVQYGLFTFRIAEAMLNGRNATVEDVRDALDRIVKADTARRQAQNHRVESTRPDMPMFDRTETGRQRTDTIRILEPSGMRGATVMEAPKIDLVGVVDWASPAKAVLVEGQPARLLGDGRFSATVTLRAGVNTISVLGLTRDDEIHVMPPLEVVFDGDLKALKGEGKRYALIIANQNYTPETRFAPLATPIADAEALRDVLTARYGFTTELPLGAGEAMSLLLVDAGRSQIEDALFTLGQVAGEQDTVLIYYAGHGVYDERTTNAYWVPVDATKPYNYLSGSAITEHVQRIMARSVILISDSCYAGALRGGESAPAPAVTDQDRDRSLLRMAELRSRMLITSGGTEPVMDTGGGGHSIFARALLTGLSDMQDHAFSAEELFSRYIRPMVSGRAEQMPQIRPIERTGHDPAADVVFVRLDTAGAGEEPR